MPRITLEEIKDSGCARDHRFVPPDYECDDRRFAEITDPGVIANMTLQLDLHAKHCELVHGPGCSCPALQVTKTSERTMLVLHEAR